MLCDSSAPATSGGVYCVPYLESVNGQFHGHRTRGGVEWTRNANHPPDPECPECSGYPAKAAL